jgi:arylsulfatase A-like enzyme
MQPNVLFILCDQLRRDSLSLYGGPVRTPNLDRLAAEGTIFRQAYCVNPMCTPARAALLTGRFNHALQDVKGRPYFFNDRLLDPGEVSVAKSLTGAGYDCHYIGKWHTDDGVPGSHIPRGERRFGFDGFWAGVNSGAPRVGAMHYTDDGEPVRYEGQWEPDMQTDLAIDVISQGAAADRPFFLFLSWVPPHRPYTLSAARQGLLDEARQQITAEDVRRNVPSRLRDAALEESIHYHANVLGLDDNVGRLMEHLERTGLADDTLVVFTADHGECLLSHGIEGKNQFYEEAAAIPFLARWPGRIAAGRRADDFFNMTDVAPTLLDLCGAAIPERMQGVSFAPFLRGDAAAGPHDSAYLEIHHPWWDYIHGQGPQGHRRCIVTDEWKFVMFDAGERGGIPWQLYDRKNDPHELNNLADDPGCIPTICELAKRMFVWMRETDDPFIDIALKDYRAVTGKKP